MGTRCRERAPSTTSISAAKANGSRGRFAPDSGRRSACVSGLIEAMLVILTKEENDHARRREPIPGGAQAHPMEQGEADRSEAASSAKTHLVDPHQASKGRP